MTTKGKIDMQHGFMQSIIRNQVDRDNYDKEMKGKPNFAVTTSRTQKPEKPKYQPPNRRTNNDLASTNGTHQAGDTVKLFTFKYTDENNVVHSMDISQGQDAQELASKFGQERGFRPSMVKALAEFLRKEIKNVTHDKSTGSC